MSVSRPEGVNIGWKSCIHGTRTRRRKDKRYTYTNDGVVGVVGWASLSFQIVLIYRSLYSR
jgi:hypothetical protein